MTLLASISAVRLTTISKCSAALLVLLIVLPFTPPFSTCGLSDLIGEVATDHGPTPAGKILQEGAPAIGVARPLAPTLVATAISSSTPSVVHSPGETRPANLRL